MRLLVVDDDPTVRELLSMDLREDGHEVVVASDGDTAQGLLAEPSFDAVILDVMIPGMTGWELLEWVKGPAGVTVPVLLLTARDVADDVRRGYELGASAVLPKPYDLDKLRLVLETLTQAERQPPRTLSPEAQDRVPAPFPGRWAGEQRGDTPPAE